MKKNLLRETRNRYRIKQSEITAKTGISQSLLSCYENSKVKCDVAVKSRILTAIYEIKREKDDREEELMASVQQFEKALQARKQGYFPCTTCGGLMPKDDLVCPHCGDYLGEVVPESEIYKS